MISRRNFLIGIGGLVTTSFLARARTHLRQAGAPLLLEPKKAEETLFLYEGLTEPDGTWGAKYRITLGPIDDGCVPPAPTWREHLKDIGYALETHADHARVYRDVQVGPDEFDGHIDELWWENYWEYTGSPAAKAYSLLEGLDLHCDPKTSGQKAGTMYFTQWGGHPGSNERWVDLKDDLSVSILQARLIERDLPIKVMLGSL